MKENTEVKALGDTKDGQCQPARWVAHLLWVIQKFVLLLVLEK
jgi:hypothetical protein